MNPKETRRELGLKGMGRACAPAPTDRDCVRENLVLDFWRQYVAATGDHQSLRSFARMVEHVVEVCERRNKEKMEQRAQDLSSQERFMEFLVGGKVLQIGIDPATTERIRQRAWTGILEGLWTELTLFPAEPESPPSPPE